MKTKIRLLILICAVIISYFTGNILSVTVQKNIKEENVPTVIRNYKIEDLIPEPKVYDDLTLDELAEKLNRTLNSTISGQGYLIASYSLEKGVDPYLALAIIMHETGCKWNCSTLVKSCNNVGGQKGSPSCNGESYKRYNSLEEGIKGYIDNLANNYYAYGLTTPETMNRKYAGSTTWASKVNAYIEDIKKS